MSFLAHASMQVLDTLCPMHLTVSQTGHITHVGPTLRKLRPGRRWTGLRFLEMFRMVRPRAVSSMREFRAIAGHKLHMELRDAPRTPLKGLAVPGDDGSFVVNLSFGIAVVDAVRDFALTDADFAATDLAIEMLYLIEAQSAAMAASRTLNARLDAAKAAAEQQALTDPLTGLGNRRAMDMTLSRLVASKTPLALFNVDLDHFKTVNDTMGHAAGDQVLAQVATVFRKETREQDLLARVGGDEFVIVMPEVTDRRHLERIGRRIIDGLETPIYHLGMPCQISGSIGMVIWDACSPSSPDTLLDDADIALYASKNTGRAQMTFYAPQLREAAQNLEDPRGRSVELWD